MGKKGKVTSERVASAASKLLRSDSSSKTAKSAAGSALSQRGSTKVTSSRVASAASKVLKSGNSSRTAKSAAGSALTQKGRK